ncbi:MAG TPA: tetraacyldisaccharide 4'-kinase, partial [Elusimicrobiales bacterium]|nr:tetraacyldisaccharide 4'-kinase [Elusimicrobiales bacterium]
TVLRNFQNQVLLMDDGFQHYRLYRDTDIVLLDAQNPFGEDALLPLGLLREPLSALSRANAVLLTHCDQVPPEKIEEIKARLAELCPDAPVILSEHQPEYYLDVCKAEKLPLEQVSGAVTSLSGIGDPDSFEGTLKHLKLDLKQIWRYPDHHPYTLEELRSAQELRNGLPLVTTYKDFTRFPKEWRTVLPDSVYVLSVHLRITENEKEWLKAIYPKLANKK